MDPDSVLKAARESGEAGETGESGAGEVDSELYNISVAEPAPRSIMFADLETEEEDELYGAVSHYEEGYNSLDEDTIDERADFTGDYTSDDEVDETTPR
jgi:hypothetical protein